MYYRDKRFTKVGNSYALIIDRRMLASCAIEVHDMVRIKSDGLKLTVEPVPVDEFEPGGAARLAWEIKKNAFGITWELIGGSMSRDDLVALGAIPGESRYWLFHQQVASAKGPSRELELVMDRLEYFRAHVRQLGFEEAIAYAIAMVPSPILAAPVERPNQEPVTEAPDQAPWSVDALQADALQAGALQADALQADALQAGALQAGALQAGALRTDDGAECWPD